MRALYLSALLLLGLLVFAAPGAAAAPPDDAIAAIVRALELLQDAERAPAQQQRAQVQAALRALDQAPLAAESAWLREPLMANPPDLSRARTRLEATLAALQLPTGGGLEPESARSRLHRLLAAPPFQARDWLALLPPGLRPLVDVLSWFFKLVGSAATWVVARFLAVAAYVFLSPLVLLLGLVVVTALVLLYRRALRSAIIVAAETKLPGVTRPTSPEALATAQEYARTGRYRDACHFVLLSTLLWLDEHGGVPFDPAATNLEHVDRVRTSPSLAAALGPLVASFDRLWYGRMATTKAAYEALLAQAQRVREVVS